MTDMSAAAVAERAVARMTEFVRAWKRRGRPAIIARAEENPAAISVPEKTLTVYDVEAVLAENAELRVRAEQTKNALAGATEANTMLRKGITKTRAEIAELRERIVSDLYDVAEELKQQADQAGADNRTGQTVLLAKADTYADAAERVRSQS